MHLLENPVRSEVLLAKTLDIKHRFYASSAEPLTHKELIAAAERSGDHALIEAFHDHSLGYAESGGSLDLRREIARLYGANISADNIVVFPGAQTGMTLTAQALLHGGDHTIVVTPSYQSIEDGARLAGSEITRVALMPDDGWELDLKAVAAAIKANTRYIAFNDPHNPSGALMSLATKQALIALAETHDLLIFSDEVYRLLELDPAERTASMAELSRKPLRWAPCRNPGAPAARASAGWCARTG